MDINFLQGRNISLQKSSTHYAPFIFQAYHNKQFMSLYRLSQKPPNDIEEVIRRIQHENRIAEHLLYRVEWVILKNGVPLGLASLAEIDFHNNRAEWLLGIIDVGKSLQALSLEAALLLMDYGFNGRNLHKITGITYGYNDKSQKCTTKLGFTFDGVLREHYKTSDGYVDLRVNSIMQKEFRNSNFIARTSKRFLNRDITKTNLGILT